MEEEIRVITKKHLSKIKRVSFSLERASTYEEALEKISEQNHDVYLIDYGLGVKTGIDLVSEVKDIIPDKPIIFLTGQKNNNIDMDAMNMGVTDYLIKDQIGHNSLERSIRYALNQKKLERKIRQEEELKSLILETTSSAICLMDLISGEILEVNSAFKYLFGLESPVGMNFNDSFEIKKYSDVLYDHSLAETHTCLSEVEECPCYASPMDVVVIVNGNEADPPISCKMSCRAIEIENGNRNLFKVTTFVDITKSKMIEKKLIETQKDIRKIVKDYGLATKDASVMMSLASLELDRMKNIEEVLSI